MQRQSGDDELDVHNDNVSLCKDLGGVVQIANDPRGESTACAVMSAAHASEVRVTTTRGHTRLSAMTKIPARFLCWINFQVTIVKEPTWHNRACARRVGHRIVSVQST